MLSLTLVALSRGQTLVAGDGLARGFCRGGPVNDTLPGPPSDMQSLPRSPHSRQQPLSTLFAADTSAHPFPCSFVPQMRVCAPQHHLSSRATLASCVLPPTRSSGGEREMGLKGWFGARYTVIKWDCLGERRRRRVEYYVLSCIPLQHCCFFVFARADFDAVSPYLCSPGSHVS